jgi:hypothetical protein
MRRFFQHSLVGGLVLAALQLRAASTLSWNTNSDRVTADIKSAELIPVLEGVAKLTGWHVFLESNTTLTVSTTFKDVPSGEAMRLMFPDLNFAFVPETNGPSQLYIFRTSRSNAKQQLPPVDLSSGKKLEATKIPNELIVRLKPGADIDELAKKLGAKVIGKIDGLNAYRLQFSDEAAADGARSTLSGNSDVASVENNFTIDQPPPVAKLDSSQNLPPPLQMKLNPPGDNGRIMVGLVDTAVQPTGTDLDKFLAKSLSVAGQANADSGSPTHGTSMFQDILRGASSASSGASSMQILSVDVYGPNAQTSTFDVAAGVVTAVNNGANIINLSLGSPGDSPMLHDYLQQLAKKGIPVFAATGNEGSPTPMFPAAYPEVISVTAGNNGKLAPYANYGSDVKLMFPGSAVVYFNNTPYLVSGTSTATALASGLAAGAASAKGASPSAGATAVLNSPTFRYTPPK